MNERNDILWSAYLDGELSAAEASRFNQSLSPSERQRLADEMRLETALADALSRGSRCPTDVWDHAKAAVLQRAAPHPNIFQRPLRWKDLLAFAALIAIVASAYTGFQMLNKLPSFLETPERHVADLQREAEIPGNDLSRVNAYFQSHGFAIDIHPGAKGFDEPPHHRRELLGAREAEFHGESVMEVLFDCCGVPTKIVVAPKDSAAASAITKAAAAGKVQESRAIGDYVAAVVGWHRAGNLLDFVGPESPSGTPKV